MSKPTRRAKIELTAWESRALPGDTLTYFVGQSLGESVEYSKKRKTPSADHADTINRIRQLYNLGRLALTQRRLSRGNDSQFAYEATWLRQPVQVNPQDHLPYVKPFVGDEHQEALAA